MKYAIGVDLHKETAVIAVLDMEGKIVEQKTFSTKCKHKPHQSYDLTFSTS